MKMRLSAPKKGLFLVSLVLAVLAVTSAFVSIPNVSENAFWILTGGYVALAAGVFFKGI